MTREASFVSFHSDSNYPPTGEDVAPADRAKSTRWTFEDLTSAPIPPRPGARETIFKLDVALQNGTSYSRIESLRCERENNEKKFYSCIEHN